MTAFTLKAIACIAMAIDHYAYYLYDSYGLMLALRGIGRIAMPIFAFFIAEGYRKTSSKVKYALRLLLFAIISEVPFDMYFFGTAYYPGAQNIYFTLFLALIAMWVHDAVTSRYKSPMIGMLCVFFFCLAADSISADYGWQGIATCFVFYLFPIEFSAGKKASAIALCAIFLVSVYAGDASDFTFLQILRLAALPLLFMYNGKQTNLSSPTAKKAARLAFYAFYPVHIALLYFIVL